MDVIEMYCTADWVRNYIMLYNWRIGRHDFRVFEESLMVNMQKMYSTGRTDPLYWIDSDIDFKMICATMNELNRVVEEKDFVALYDLLNLEIWGIVQGILKTIAKKSNDVLQDYFWVENKNALKKRYPDLLKQIEGIYEREKFIRSYGTRGRVLYRISGDRDYDLYSAYSPIELGLQLTKVADFEKYNKVYIWGTNGAFEVSGIKTKFVTNEIYIYIYDLVEFKRLLTNTLRRDLLLDPRVHWKYAIEAAELLNSIDLKKKDECYIYMTHCYEEESTKIEKFIHEYFIDSNIEGEKY